MSRYRLSFANGRYYLSDSFSSQKPLSLSFSSSKFLRRVKAASKTSELIARAVGIRHGLKVIDCTAGFGKGRFLTCVFGMRCYADREIQSDSYFAPRRIKFCEF